MRHWWDKFNLIIAKAVGWVDQKMGQQSANNKMDERAWVALINEALKDWKAAENNFNFFTDLDLVDYSIFSINAAQKRYLHLIRKAKELNVLADFPTFTS